MNPRYDELFTVPLEGLYYKASTVDTSPRSFYFRHKIESFYCTKINPIYHVKNTSQPVQNSIV